MRTVRLHVAQRHGLPQALQGVAGGDEFLADVPLIADFEQRLHDWRIVDFLLLIELTAARVAGCVHMRDVVTVLAKARNDIAVHDLNVIDVEEQLQIGEPTRLMISMQ